MPNAQCPIHNAHIVPPVEQWAWALGIDLFDFQPAEA
jgi:hypothetical protein